MSHIAHIEGLHLFLLSLAIVYILYSDISYRKIPNLVSFFVALGGLLLIAIHPSFTTNNLVVAFICLIGGILLYALNIFGAGDVKFLVALVLNIPSLYLSLFFMMFFMSIIIFGTVQIIFSLFFENKFLWAGFGKIRPLDSLKLYTIKKAPFAGVFFITWFLLIMNL